MTTKIYFIRHGIAADPAAYENDRDRPLTEDGRRKTQKVGKRLRELDIKFDLILTSPLIRARQTAEILKGAGLSAKLEESSFLMPDGDMNNWLLWLEEWRGKGGENLALVGHQPDLANWAEMLVWGDQRDKLVLKKAGIIAVSLPEGVSPQGRCLMFWLTPPKFLLV